MIRLESGWKPRCLHWIFLPWFPTDLIHHCVLIHRYGSADGLHLSVALEGRTKILNVNEGSRTSMLFSTLIWLFMCGRDSLVDQPTTARPGLLST
jgi:hypothetical protein